MREALAYDLMERGRSIHDLGSPRLSWLEVKALLDWAPQDSAVAQLISPMSRWSTPEAVLMALAVDALHGANWQRSGGRKSDLPKRVRDVLADALTPKPEVPPVTPQSLERVRREMDDKRRRMAAKARQARAA